MSFNTEQMSYVDLRNILSENSNGVVAWVGAGLSVPAGMPTWASLAQLLIEELSNRKEHTSDGETKAAIDALLFSIHEEHSYWSKFSSLKHGLGKSSYEASVRRAFKKADSVAVPEVYKRLWRLGIKGMINLNIDRLANRAYNETFQNGVLNHFTGDIISDCVWFLRADKPWLANLHGEVTRTGSWVFTEKDLKWLSTVPGYSQFISSCFTSRTVVFIGISANDTAAGGHLQRLTESGIDCGGHFWITHDPKTNRDWAEQAGLRLIEYSAKDGDHSELFDLLDDLESYIPTEPPATPVKPSTAFTLPIEPLPEPEALLSKSASEIRNILNAEACRILTDTNEKSIKEFEEFSSKYSEPIYRAWYVSEEEGSNTLFDYTLTSELAEGAFGKVYTAQGKDGKQYAVKILHEKIRKHHEMLQSFRGSSRNFVACLLS